MWKQINSNSFKNENTNKLFAYKSYMYIHLNGCERMTDVKLLLLHSNTWNHLTLSKQIINNKLNYLCQKYLKPFNCEQKISSGSFKNVINKMCLQIMYIWYICINRIWKLITSKGWYAIKLNQRTDHCFHHPHCHLIFQWTE